MRRTPPHLARLIEHADVISLARHLGAGADAIAHGAAGSSTHLIAGAVSALAQRPVVLVVPHLDQADEALDELESAGLRAWRFPALEVLPGETAPTLELHAERLAVVRKLTNLALNSPPFDVLVTPIQALMQGVPAPQRLRDLTLSLAPGDALGPDAVINWLANAGYSRVDSIEEPSDFAVRGGIIDILPTAGALEAQTASGSIVMSTGEAGVRLDFFGDELESIAEIDIATMGSDQKLARIDLLGMRDGAPLIDDAAVSPIEVIARALPDGFITMLADTLETTEQARGYYERIIDARGIFGPPEALRLLREHARAMAEVNHLNAGSTPGVTTFALPIAPLPDFAHDAADAVRELGALSAEQDVIVLAQTSGEDDRFRELLHEFAPDTAARTIHYSAYLHRGFILESLTDARNARPIALVPYHELLHRYQSRRRIARLKGGRATEAFMQLNTGDYVVHVDHGIARFTGLTTMKATKRKTKAELNEAAFNKFHGKDDAHAETAGVEEYLVLEFAGRSKLYVPAHQIDRVQKYIGSGGSRGARTAAPTLSTLGSKRWSNQKQSVKESVRELAGELLRVQAARQAMPGVRYPADTPWQTEFEAEFPYQETEDQLAGLADIKRDMATERPMDRLVCGDVGYGKTELAIRAAFKAVEVGKQVAVLVPTTLLAEQHERTFRQRFAGYPFVIESLSRFKTRGEQNAVLARARKGQVDVIIGTHRLLSKDVHFADLGLVIVDEEQRFGVEHKNALLRLRMTADVLTLSATPIPRTLHMSMLGLRDISSLTTPPLDRRAVVTEVIPHNRQRIKRSIDRELAREGQVFFIHNRVHNIKTIADDIQRLAPDARIVIGHGQMPDGELEKVMLAFINRDADILVSTTIVESGIDIPSANTMFINDAHMFGLAELHQLRGRVGRSKHRGYCYLLLPQNRPVPEIAQKRLRAVEEFSMLGAGFKIAMRDLEIRGAGNLLGAEQSGHIAAVGYDMYCRLLDTAAKELRGEPTHEASETAIELGIAGAIPRSYILADARRLEAYRRIAIAQSPQEVDAVETDLTAAYGAPPEATATLLELARVRAAAAALGVRSIALKDKDVMFRCDDPDAIAFALKGAKGSVRILSESASSTGEGVAEVAFRPPEQWLEPSSLLTLLRRRLMQVAPSQDRPQASSSPAASPA